MRKKLIFTVTSDLTYDQRMERICAALSSEGFEVTLVGRRKRDSIALVEKSYKQRRLSCFWEKGKLFYIEYNIRLFLFLLFQKADVICAIDLDTIIACYYAGRLKGWKLVYDAHEYYTEVIEVVNRPGIQKIWKAVERFFVPKYDAAYTVSESIANIFTSSYQLRFDVIRNTPVLEEVAAYPEKGERYLIYIGVVNAGRGIEQLIRAMQYIDSKLYICGKGDVLEEMQKLVLNLGLEDKVIFLGYLRPDKLREVTRGAWLGYLLLEASSKSYYYSLANKFFDYIHAGIPQVTIDFPEYRLINSEYKVAELVELDVDQIVGATNRLLTDEMYYRELSENTSKARLKYNWQREAEKLIDIYRTI